MNRIPYGQPVAAQPLTVANGESDAGTIFGAAIEQMRLVDNTNAAQAALEDAYAARTRAIKSATGIDLGNPLIADQASLDAADEAEHGRGDLLAQMDTIVARQRQAYGDRLQQLTAQFPQHSAAIKASTPLERDAEALARGADEDLARLMEATPGWGKFAASLGGSLAGSLRDPLTVGSLFVGGGVGAGRTVAARILGVAAREALINAGTEAAAQPFVQDWRARAGLPNGFDQAATNVLLAAGLGGVFGAGAGGLHEVVRALRPARAALSPEQRGALDAAELDVETAAARPPDLPAERFDRASSVALARVQDMTSDAVEPDEIAVRQIVNSLAPSPDSVSGRTGERTDAEIDQLVLWQPKPAEGTGRVSKPIFDHIRRLGGVDPSSPAAAELRAIGVDSPSLYKRGGLKALDNLPHSELPAEVRHAIEPDGNGYASQQGIIDAIGRENDLSGKAEGFDDGARAFYEREGVDFSRPIEDVRAQIRAVDDATWRWTAPSDEAVSVPEGLTRREHTAELVRQVLRAQPGLSDQLVRDAVNLALFERQPILEALDDVMSTAAGVRKTLPAASEIEVARLADEALPASADLENPDLDLTAELEALEELGFTGSTFPIGDSLVSFRALEEELEALDWETKVLEACKI